MEITERGHNRRVEWSEPTTTGLSRPYISPASPVTSSSLIQNPVSVYASPNKSPTTTLASTIPLANGWYSEAVDLSIGWRDMNYKWYKLVILW